jgi:hypothetical protein
MDAISIRPAGKMGVHFIAGDFLPKGKNEYYLRNRQLNRPQNTFRHLKADEIKILTENGNTASSWEDVRVSDPFNPALIRNTEFLVNFEI